MRWGKKQRNGGAPAAVQVREGGVQPFSALGGYVPLGGADVALYRSIREAVPLVDAAVGKLVRLCGGVRVRCGDAHAEEELDEFLRAVDIGRGQTGFNAFLESYLDSLLTCGRAVGEAVPDAEGRDIAAVLCHRVEQVQLREGATALDTRFWGYDRAGRLRELPRQELVLFTPLAPEPENPYGVSLLRSMPFMSELLVKIYYAMGQNWERCGNVRFAVVYKPQGEETDSTLARERAELLAQEWGGAMRAARSGSVRDFVSVGDVSIRAIGADNVMPDSEVPVRQILEQLVAKTGLPPFLLGLSWSSTERMSSQQADMLTSEITALRRSLTPMVERVCRLWLRLHGYGCRFAVEWDDINLQDMVEEARAELYREQARKLRQENDKREKAT
nr:MAG TPA: portal protein [Caudoviricetes sp.]